SNSANFDSVQPNQNPSYYPSKSPSAVGPPSQPSNPPPLQTGNYQPRPSQQFNSQPYSPQQYQLRAPQQGPILRRTDSRSFILPQQQGNIPPGPPGQQRPPLNFQPQNWNRPLRPPLRPDQQYRPPAPNNINSDQYRPQQVTQNGGDQYNNNYNYRPTDANRLNSSEQFRPQQDPVRAQTGQNIESRQSEVYTPPPLGQYYQPNQQQQQPPQQINPGQRPPFIRKPSPWTLLKEKLPPQLQGNRFPFPLRNAIPPDKMSQNRSPTPDQKPQQTPVNQAPNQNSAQPPTTPQNLNTTPSSQMERTTLNFSMNDMPPRQIPPNVRPIRPLMRVDSRMMAPMDPNFRMPQRPSMMPNDNRGRDSPSGQPLPPGMRMPNYPENPNYQRPPGMISSQASSTSSSTPKSHRSSIDEDEDIQSRRDIGSRPPSAGGNIIDPRILQEKRPSNQRADDVPTQNGRNLLRPEMVRLNTPPLSDLQQRDGMPSFDAPKRIAESPTSIRPNRPTDLKIMDGFDNNLVKTPSTPMTPSSGDLKRHLSMRQSKRIFRKGSTFCIFNISVFQMKFQINCNLFVSKL
ncbi:hypothetical protein WDU94_006667, partial [Cyamophila willieti]